LLKRYYIKTDNRLLETGYHYDVTIRARPLCYSDVTSPQDTDNQADSMVEGEGMRSIGKLSLSAFFSMTPTPRHSTASVIGDAALTSCGPVWLRVWSLCRPTLSAVRCRLSADKQTTHHRGSSAALEISDQTPLDPVLSRSSSPARQAKRCDVINVCARDAISLSLPAAAADAAHICFDIRVPRHVPVHCTGARPPGARGHCAPTAAFDAGMIGG